LPLAIALLGLTVQAFAQVPVINSFVPVKAKTGEVVHLVGNNFSAVAASNIVNFGAVRALVSNASPTNLDVIVPAGATVAPPSVTVAGLSAQAKLMFLPTWAGAPGIDSLSFLPKVDFVTPSWAATVAVGDLDGDGKPDLFVGNYNAGNVSVLRNVGSNGIITSASFAPPVTFATGSTPMAYLGDADGDGRLDILVANNGNGSGNTISIFRNVSTAGDITTNSFAAAVNFVVGSGPIKIVTADIDGDGWPDVVVANGSGGISLLRNTSGPGEILSTSFATAVAFATGSNVRDVVAADLDGDGKMDLAVANFDSKTVSLFRNIATSGTINSGSLAARQDISLTDNLYNISVVDLDGDGRLDLVLDNRASSVDVLRNIGSPGSLSASSFAAKVSLPVGGDPYMVAVGDIDGDGTPDLAASVMNVPGPSLLQNMSSPGAITNTSFGAYVHFVSAGNPRVTALADLNADGKPDLVVAGDAISVLQNITPVAMPPLFTQQPSSTVAVAGTGVSLVSASVGSTPRTYQWFKDNLPVDGATNATLTFSSANWSQAGVYTVTVTNLFGSVTSSNAQLTIYAHHFDWAAIPSPQAPSIPFAVAITAKDALNQIISNFNGSVSLFALATNRPGTNFNFEAGSLEPWTPLNLGNQPGPYSLVSYDVNGDGNFSTAFRIAANAGTGDGISQNVFLRGGVTYSVKLDIATDNLTGGNNLDGGITTIVIGDSTVRQFSWGAVSVGKIYRTNLAGTFTPTTNGFYPVTLTFQRAFVEAGNLWCLADDLILQSYGPAIDVSPAIASGFVNGIWSGSLTLVDGGDNIKLRADDGAGHFGDSNPFNVTNALAPTILVGPASQYAVGGDTVSFNASADGAPPLTYIWRKNGTNIAGATGVSLTLSNVTRFFSADYSVVVTNTYGSVTSSNAQLKVRVPQRLGNPTRAGITLTMTSGDVDGGALTAADLARFSVQTSTNLVDWSTLPVTLVFSNGGFRFTDSIVTNRPVRFYRVVEN